MLTLDNVMPTPALVRKGTLKLLWGSLTSKVANNCSRVDQQEHSIPNNNVEIKKDNT